jgi:hypothetical protein
VAAGERWLVRAGHEGNSVMDGEGELGVRENPDNELFRD